MKAWDIAGVDAWKDARIALATSPPVFSHDLMRLEEIELEASSLMSIYNEYRRQRSRITGPRVIGDVTDKLARIVVLAILTIQHFTKDADTTINIVDNELDNLVARMSETRKVL